MHLPLYHPIRLLINLKYVAFAVVIPFSYLAIYCFRRKHDRQVQGGPSNKFYNLPIIISILNNLEIDSFWTPHLIPQCLPLN